MNKKKFIIAIVGVISLFAAASLIPKKKSVPEQQIASEPLGVSVQSAQNSREFAKEISYPGTIVGDQEITVTATSAGTATRVDTILGNWISAGSLIAKIDNIGVFSEVGAKNFRSGEVQQALLSKRQAKEALELAERNYKDLKKAYEQQQEDSSLTKTVTEAQVNAAKNQIDIAELQVDSAEVGYDATLDNHIVTSPIGGYVTSKAVSEGDSVSVGQTLATISKTGKIKIAFYVDQQQLASIYRNLEVSAVDNEGNRIAASVRNISPSADPVTKRFLVEAYPQNGNAPKLYSGSVVNVIVRTIEKPKELGSLILPLSAVTVGQNESNIFIVKEGKAIKTDVRVVRVSGETAEIKAAIPEDAQIIIGGNKLVKNEDTVSIIN